MDNNGNVVMTKEQAEFTLNKSAGLIRNIYKGVDNSTMELLCDSLGVSVADFELIADGKVKVV